MPEGLRICDFIPTDKFIKFNNCDEFQFRKVKQINSPYTLSIEIFRAHLEYCEHRDFMLHNSGK